MIFKHLLRVLPFLVFLVFSLGTNAQSGCPSRSSVPLVSVEIIDNGVVYDFTKTGNDMMRISTITPPAGMALRGLTEAKIETRVSIQISGLGNCAWPSQVRVQVGFFVPQTVYVDRNYTPGTCQHQVILAHEQLHVTINRDSVNEMASFLRDGLHSAVNHPNYPMRFSDQAWVRNAITTSISEYINSVSAYFDQVRQQRHAALDTPENYRATSAMCTGW
jgi:hypothetical protein